MVFYALLQKMRDIKKRTTESQPRCRRYGCGITKTCDVAAYVLVLGDDGNEDNYMQDGGPDRINSYAL
jgi:hypothetical protein